MPSVSHTASANADEVRDHEIISNAGFALGKGACVIESGDCSRTKAGTYPRFISFTDAEGNGVATRDVPKEVVQAAFRLVEGGALGKPIEWAVLYDFESAERLELGSEALVFTKPIGAPQPEMALVNTPEDAVRLARDDRDGKRAFLIGARGRAWGEYNDEDLFYRMQNDIGTVSLAEREGNGPWRLIMD